ncbi:MAG: 6-phosphofructokinase, partial [Fusobacteriaceae bacterium]
TSHERTILVEVMGRHAGDLALYSCMAGGGDGLLIPEMDNPIEMLALQIKDRRKSGKLHDIVLVAEGVGKVSDIEEELKHKVNSEVRSVVLGHVQRGGAPSGFDRILATKMAVKAVEILVAGDGGVMVGMEGNKIVTHPISYAWEGQRFTSISEDFEIARVLSK